MDLLPDQYRHLNPVGRLDKGSEGLLLFTSDGELLNQLTHARFGHRKKYQVLVRGNVEADTLEQIRRGGQILDDYALKPMEAHIIGEKPGLTWLEITLGEGRKRQIRRVMEMFGHNVIRLIRTQIGGLTLEPLTEGEWRVLSPNDLKKLHAK